MSEASARLARGDADEHVGLPLVGDPVAELRDVAIADDLAQPPEAPPLLGDRDREQRLALLADLGTLGDEAEPVEVHVRPAGDRHQRLVPQPARRDVLLHRGDAHRPGRFEDAPRVLEHVLDRGADRVGVDDDEVVDQRPGQAERLLAHLLDGRPVGEQADVVERDAFARPDGADHRVRVGHLDPDDLDLRPHRLDVRGDAGDEASAPDGDEHRVDRALVLAQDLHADGPLPGDHVRVVERMHEGVSVAFLQPPGVEVGVGVAVAVQDHLAPERAHGVGLQPGRRQGHDDHGAASEPFCAEGDALGVVARGRADDPAAQFLGREAGHLVVGPAELEAEDRLGILALEPRPVCQAGPRALRQAPGAFPPRHRRRGRSGSAAGSPAATLPSKPFGESGVQQSSPDHSGFSGRCLLSSGLHAGDDDDREGETQPALTGCVDPQPVADAVGLMIVAFAGCGFALMALFARGSSSGSSPAAVARGRGRGGGRGPEARPWAAHRARSSCCCRPPNPLPPLPRAAPPPAATMARTAWVGPTS